jgi:hypothetical protein
MCVKLEVNDYKTKRKWQEAGEHRIMGGRCGTHERERETRNVYDVLVGKSEGKRHRRR